MARQRESPISLGDRRRTKYRLDATPNIDDAATARFIYDAMVKVADRMSEANKLLDTKANGVVALSSALLGFGANSANGHHIVHWQLAIAAIASLLLAIGSALRVNFITSFDLPSPGHYNAAAIASDSNNEAKIAVELAESWHHFTTDERTISRRKIIWLNRSTFFMTVGLAAFAALAVEVLFADRVAFTMTRVVY